MVDKKNVDVAVIGSGPGGYTAAIRAAQFGKSVALIEKGLLGGTCLNVGCIPSKALLAGSSLLHQIRKASEFGISTGPVSVDYGAMKRRKDRVVGKIRSGLEGLIGSNRISIVRGEARFESPRELKVAGQDNLYIAADQVIIATGSIPFDVPAFPCDHKRILNSTSMLEVIEIPSSLCIVGGGYIGCEFASLFAELGTKVTVLEALPAILSPQGAHISGFLTKAFTAKGISIRTDTKVEKIVNRGQAVHIALADGGALDADLCLVAIGRKTYTEGLMLEKAGLCLTDKGTLETDGRMETAVKGIYAIGDITGKWMLAHVASHQGLVAASNAAGHEETIRYDAVPAVIFTSPEIAMVGMTQEMASAAGKKVTIGMFPFQALGKAQAGSDTEGFTQVISDKDTGQILGASVIGHGASDLIAEMALAIQNELTLDCIIETIHAHPTVAEGWLEAALIAADRPVNFPPKAKK